MDGNTIGAGGAIMNANEQVSANGSIYPRGMFMFGATVLILLGLTFETAEFGWAHLWPKNLWLFSVIVPGIWNMLAVQSNAPIWQELLKFWPLALVATGTAVLLAQKRAYVRERSGKARSGGNHNE
jgi:hypothetical protein